MSIHAFIKLDILTGLKKLASDIPQNTSINIDFFYKALSYVSYDMEEKAFLELLEDMKDLKDQKDAKNEIL